MLRPRLKQQMFLNIKDSSSYNSSIAVGRPWKLFIAIVHTCFGQQRVIAIKRFLF